jgi:hypothetical protein
MRRYGIDWSPLTPYLANEPRSVRLAADALLAPPAEGSPLPLLPAPDAADLAVDVLHVHEDRDGTPVQIEVETHRHRPPFDVTSPFEPEEMAV